MSNYTARNLFHTSRHTACRRKRSLKSFCRRKIAISQPVHVYCDCSVLFHYFGVSMLLFILSSFSAPLLLLLLLFRYYCWYYAIFALVFRKVVVVGDGLRKMFDVNTRKQKGSILCEYVEQKGIKSSRTFGSAARIFGRTKFRSFWTAAKS